LTGNLTPELKTDERNEYFIAQLLTASITYDEAHFEKVFSQCLLGRGLKETYNQVIYPLLNRIGLMWTKDTIVPAQEHFISNLIRQKLFSALDSLPPAKTNAETWLLFLPENEHHDMGLLFANYLIRSAGKKVFYLGDNVPFSSLESAVKDTKAQNMLLLLVHYDFVKDTQDYIDQLSHNFSSKNIFIAGNQKLISKLSLGSKLHWLKSIEELNTLLLP
jgi:methanogenic corrinoid protein MtbC1